MKSQLENRVAHLERRIELQSAMIKLLCDAVERSNKSQSEMIALLSAENERTKKPTFANPIYVTQWPYDRPYSYSINGVFVEKHKYGY